MLTRWRAFLARACRRRWAGGKGRGTSRRPAVEPLEDRCVPSGFPVHRHITTTWFYVGESADAANGFIANYALFQDRFFRNANGDIVGIDTRWINAGETKTSGLEFSLRGMDGANRGAGPAGQGAPGAPTGATAVMK